jgi:hypothetical protein
MTTDENNPMFGRVHTEESRNKMRDKKLGVPKSAEHRRKISLAMKGKKKTELTKQHMRESWARRKASKQGGENDGS